MWRTRLVAALAVAFLLLPSGDARACASCGCGDPTLTSMGTEQPFAGRLRLATQMRAWGLASGQLGENAAALRELRMDLSVAYAPTPWLFLSAMAPLLPSSVVWDGPRKHLTGARAWTAHRAGTSRRNAQG